MREPELVRIAAGEERALILAVLGALGTGAEEATDQARVLVEGDLRGHPSHGVQRLPVIAERVRHGLIRPGAAYEPRWAGDAMLTVDGRFGFGPHIARRAGEEIAARASRTGVAAAALRNASHLGMLALYVEPLAARGLVALATTTSEALVHPWGGRVALLGTNPIAVAIPTDTEPFVMDMATGAISRGEVIARALSGQQLPAGAAVDQAGNPTADPAAAEAISPFGGAKGFALGLALELLVAALTESELGDRVRGTLDVSDPVSKGDLLVVFDPAAAGVAPFGERIGDYLGDLRASPTAPGAAEVMIPGDRSRAERRRRLQDGIPLPATLWRELLELRGHLTPEPSAMPDRGILRHA